MQIEERVQIAIDNWAPRFLANGIDPNDFQRVTRRITRWDDWLGEWSACGAMHEQMGQEAEANRYYQSAGYHYLHAAMCYHFGKYMFVHRPEELRAAHERVVRVYKKALPYVEFPGERVTIPYEAGTNLVGILRKPWHLPRPPVVILSPGLDSVKEELHVYGDDFLRRGMAVLAVDGPGQGEMEFALPLRPDFEVPAHAILDFLERRPDLDASRVGYMGVSLGGHFAVRAAAYEARIKAVICLASGYNLAAHFDRYPVLTQDAFIHRLKVADATSARARLKQFDLQGVMRNITCPLLIIMGRLDRLFPAEDAERMAAESGGAADLWLFEDGNHVCNNIPYKYRPQQADWMRSKLLSL